MKKLVSLLSAFLLVFCLSACDSTIPESVNISIGLDSIPEYSGEAYIAINNNIPFFTDEEITDVSFESYGELDALNRCTTCVASIGSDLMPTEERGSIGSVKPTGWQTAKYDNVDGKYLYNRCHLIGFQLTGENANEKNLITGTRYLNIEGMLPFENMVADYIAETDNHVMYRVTPIFEGDNLLSSGVLMEGYSVEDRGEGITFCVFCYNVQPDISINYANGKSEYSPQNIKSENESTPAPRKGLADKYILNTNTKKFHYESCKSASEIKPSNKAESTKTREELIAEGYAPCGNCKP